MTLCTFPLFVSRAVCNRSTPRTSTHATSPPGRSKPVHFDSKKWARQVHDEFALRGELSRSVSLSSAAVFLFAVGTRPIACRVVGPHIASRGRRAAGRSWHSIIITSRIEFESIEFNRRFFVSSPNRRWAYDVIHPRTMEFLLGSPPIAIEFGQGTVLACNVSTFSLHERETLQAVAMAHRQAADALGSPRTRADHENTLANELRRLFLLVDRYPELKASASFIHLQQELANTEDRIQAARRLYNANVREFNTIVESFPTSLLTGSMGIRRADFFDLDNSLA